MGGSAWGEDVYTTVYEKTYASGGTQWAASDVTAWGSAANLEIEAATSYFGFKSKTGSASYTISTIKNNAKVKYEVEWYLASTNGGYGPMYTYLKLGNLYLRVTDNSQSNDIAFSTNGGTTYCDDIETKKTAKWVRNGNVVTVTAILNTAENTVESLSVSFDGNTYTTSNLATTTISGTNNKVIGLQTTSTRSGSSTSQLKSIKVSQCEQEVPTADVTFKYTDTAGNSLSSYKSDQVLEDVAQGTSISSLINSPLTDTFYNGTSNKYVYSGTYVVTGGYTTVQEGGNTVTLKFTDYPATAYTVMAQAGGSDLASVASGTAFLDGSTTAYYSKYVKHNGSWYETSSPYGVAISAATTNIAYTISDIDYFCEGENMNGYDAASDKRGTNYSGQITGRPRANSVWYTDPVTETGVYTVSFPYELIANSSASTLAGLYVRSGSGELTLIEENVSLSSNSTYTKTNVIIPAGSSFQISKGANNSNYGIDYVTLKRTGDATVPVTVSDAGFATYVPSYDLNFTSTSIKAYKVKVSTKGKATLTEVANVPAGTPVLLYKDGGATEDIPVMTGAAAVTENDLVAGTGAAVATDGGTVDDVAYTNMILNNVGGNIGFYLAAGQTVATNRAYLHIASDKAPAGARMVMVFADEETTGIADVRSKMSDVRGDFFDLQGRRVAQPAKGLYIVNGKKVVIK